MGRGRYAMKMLREFAGFARENRVYWVIPLVLVLGLAALVIVAGQTAAPLIYALF
jgi:hypothetical protein